MISQTNYQTYDRASQPFTFIDLFAGCGGLSLGMLLAGWKGLFAIEKDPMAFRTLEANLISGAALPAFQWPTWLEVKPHSISGLLSNYWREVTRLRNEVDLLIGGPPCQGFSAAGRRCPKDPRNSLIREYMAVVDVIKPKVVFLENVQGFTSSFNSKEHPAEITNYAEWIDRKLGAGYTTFSTICSASDYGIPQARKRFILIAIRRDIHELYPVNPFALMARILPKFLLDRQLGNAEISTTEAISDLEIARNGTRTSRENPRFEEIKYNGPITPYQHLMHDRLRGVIDNTRIARHRQDVRQRFDAIIKDCKITGRLNKSLSKEQKVFFKIKKSALRVLDPHAPAPTITSMPDDLLHYSEPRTLTVRENARLQSFPDCFSFQGNYTSGGTRRKHEIPRFTQVANAVPPLLAEAYGLMIAELLNAATDEAGKEVSQNPPNVLTKLAEGA